MATTSDLRTGIIIRYNGQLHRVVEFHHHAPGNWRAMVIMKLKNIQTGKTFEDRVRAGSDIEIVRVDKRPMQYLYRDGDSYHFMDNETFDCWTGGGKIILHKQGEDDLPIDINDDGTLDTPLGELKKKSG